MLQRAKGLGVQGLRRDSIKNSNSSSNGNNICNNNNSNSTSSGV